MEKELAIFGLGNAGHMQVMLEQGFDSYDQYLKELHKTYAEEGFEEIEYGLTNHDSFVKGKFAGRKIAFYEIPFGLSHISRVHRILESYPVEYAAGIGFCGSLTEEVPEHSIVVPYESALSSCVTQDPIWTEKLTVSRTDERIADALLEKAQEKGYKVLKGKILTVSNPKCETPAFVEQARNAGFHGVEMETAAVNQITNGFSVPFAPLLYVSDNQAKKNSSDFTKKVRELYRKGKHIEMFNMARDALLEVSTQQKPF